MTPTSTGIQTPSPSKAAAQTLAAAMPETTPEQRAEVQRKLGRCMLRIQQYELLTKAVLVDHDQSGTIENWEARRQARVEKFAKKTLGQLVEWMKESYLIFGAEERESAESNPPEGSNQIWFAFRGGMQKELGSYQSTVAAMQELVGLRNELVHHLLENFNLWTLQGCAAADAHLETSYELIDRHMVELGEWARHMQEAREITAKFMASKEFLDMVLAQPSSEATPLDHHSTVVERLREAEAFLAVDGWALLNDAIDFIGRMDSEETPTRYACKNWREVLRRSGVFEYQKVALPERSGLYTAYRSLGQAPRVSLQRQTG